MMNKTKTNRRKRVKHSRWSRSYRKTGGSGKARKASVLAKKDTGIITKTYRNGVVFTGHVGDRDDRLVGTLKRPDGSFYEGELFVDPQGRLFMDGVGKNTYADGGVVCTYEGQFLMGKKHGRGSETTRDGGVYVGDFKDDRADGDGRFTNPDGTFVEGHVIEQKDKVLLFLEKPMPPLEIVPGIYGTDEHAFLSNERDMSEKRYAIAKRVDAKQFKDAIDAARSG
jgi:hypothetical protein